MPTLIDYYNTNDDNANNYGNGGANIWEGQTFTASNTYTITSVKLKQYKAGNGGGTFTASIRATSAGLPTGADLCSGTLSAATWTSTTGGDWQEITLGAGALITSGVQYAICVRMSAPDGTNYMNWRLDGSSPTYSGGQRVYSSNSGSTWGSTSTQDCMFENWGNLAPSSSGGLFFGMGI